jgi:hypothetical protein
MQWIYKQWRSIFECAQAQKIAVVAADRSVCAPAFGFSQNRLLFSVVPVALFALN